MRHANQILILFLALLLAGCATSKIDWGSRVGVYTFDQAVLELGPPDKTATLQDGTQVCEWLTRRGQSGGASVHGFGRFVHVVNEPGMPDSFIRLTFDPEGRLTAHRQVYK